jgi:hypothetical protein
MPKIGARDPITNLSRSSIDRLVRPQECNGFKPPVISRCVRLRGSASRRGSRLILVSSLLEFIAREPKELRNLRDRQSAAKSGVGRHANAQA